MTRLNERYSDPEGSGATPQRATLIRHLEYVYGRPHVPDRLGAAAAEIWRRHAAMKEGSARMRPFSVRRRVISTAAIIALATAGAQVVGRWTSPPPVSAQAILHRAVAQLPRVDAAHVLHIETAYHSLSTATNVSTGAVTANQTQDSRGEFWVQVGQGGDVARSDAETYAADGSLTSRTLLVGTTRTAYDVASHTVNVTTNVPAAAAIRAAKSNYSWDFATLLQQAQQGLLQQLHVQGPQQMDGAQVYVVEGVRPVTDGTLTMQMYIDAQNYALRKYVNQTTDAHGTVLSRNEADITKYDVVTVDQVPASTFTFTPPAGAKITTATYHQ